MNDRPTITRETGIYVPLAFVVHPLLVKPDVRKIFAYRGKRLAELFASSGEPVR